MAEKKRTGLHKGIETFFPSLQAARNAKAEQTFELEESGKTSKSGKTGKQAGAGKASGSRAGAVVPAGAGTAAESAKQAESRHVDGAVTVRLTKIEPNRTQPRKMFDEDALKELADSIKQYGLIEPILVQNRGDRYEIIAGERRWRAARLAGLKEIPVIVRDYSDREIVELSLIETIQR